MPPIRIESADDPRITPYVDLRDKQLRTRDGLFIAEGDLVVERLLRSRFAVESLLVAESQLHRIEAPPEVPLYYAPRPLIETVAGFHFHRGILGCGIRPQPEDWTGHVAARQRPVTVVVCSAVRDPENLGGILRNCAAFGVDLVLIGHHSADPFSRRVLRVSMAAALQLPLHVSDDLDADLTRLHDQWQVHCTATVLDPTATRLMTSERPRRLALVLGNERSGLEPTTLARCQSRLSIPMQAGIDSLNVAVASGIFLYHFTRVVPPEPAREVAGQA
jgi:tRNA G18 (ribose-2'-O)-methylase SpoU